jgi:hypothetical protein
MPEEDSLTLGSLEEVAAMLSTHIARTKNHKKGTTLKNMTVFITT